MIQDLVQSHAGNLVKEEMLKVERWMVTDPRYIQSNQTLSATADIVEHMNIECIPVVDSQMYPIAMVTLRTLLTNFMQGSPQASVLNKYTIENNSVIRSDDSLLNVFSSSSTFFSVVDEQGHLVGVLSKNEFLKGFTKYIEALNQTKHSTETLSVVLESAYEGIAVIDEKGIIQEFNRAYSRFTGIDRADAIGRHVKQVIDNTNLHNTVITGMPDRGAIQYIQGQPMIVHRIPIWKNQKVVGAIGMLIFEGVTEVYSIYERLQKNSVQKQPKQDNSAEVNQEDSFVTLDQIIGDSTGTSSMKRQARKVAKTDATILITGESGTGKEMHAKGIHNLSYFSSGPFVSLNCGAIPEHLFESELFGYEEGAFTGAKKGGKPGKFELAQNGTLFLDEIGEMPLMMQTKLLRVLQEKEVERVGGIHPYAINARIIAATNHDLKSLMEAGGFREDLYYRINVIEIPIPSLRERSEDIPQLVSYYLQVICNKYQTPKKVLTSEALSIFLNYQWPGNVRELINVIEKLVVLVDEETITIKHLPDNIVDRAWTKEENTYENTAKIRQAKTLGDNKERELIMEVLRDTGGNKSQAAEQLGIHRTTLYQKLKKYDLAVTVSK